MNKERLSKNRSINRSIGRQIAQYRQKAGMTQVQLAEKVGMTGNWIQQIEYGNADPSAAKLILFAKTLGITVNDLIADSEHAGKEE